MTTGRVAGVNSQASATQTVRLVYERTDPPGEDSPNVEALIAVCGTEEQARRVEQESACRGRYASWEEHPLQGAFRGSTTPLAEGEVVHIVLLGDGPPNPERDPIGIAVFAEWNAANRRAANESHNTGDPGYNVVSLPIGWRGG